MGESTSRIRAHAAEILSFYMNNPGAVESLEGIVEWRLVEEVIRRRVAETDAALRWLVESGFLVRIERPGSPPLYQLAPHRIADASKLVADYTAAAEERTGDGT